VLFVYGTATVDGTGRVYFYQDLYGNDARLQKALTTGVSAPAAAAGPRRRPHPGPGK
jgi:murein L,D-transpeptidase YcbB/YkuD